MDSSYWHRQKEQSLFSELEWDKPERRDHAGKLLIVGGNIHNLSAPAHAFELVKKTGVGNVKIALPDKTKRLVGKTLPEALFLPSTASGEFSHEGEVELLDHAVWADAILMPGDNGRNSETTILFESILRAYKETIVLTRDAVDILSNSPEAIFQRDRTTLVVSFAQLQKLIKNYGEQIPLTFTMDLIKFVDFLHTFTQNCKANIVTLHQNQMIVAVNGQISSTKINTGEEPDHWRLELASRAVCYQMWNVNKPFEALTHTVSLL